LKKTIITGVRQKLIEKDVIDFETVPTPTPQPLAITPFEDRFALYTAKAETVASYFKPEPGASYATTKLLEVQVKSFLERNHPEFHYGTVNNEEHPPNAKTINLRAVRRHVLHKAAELIAKHSAGPVAAKPSEKADRLPFHQSPAFETENNEQPPAREEDITGPAFNLSDTAMYEIDDEWFQSFLNNTAFNGSGEDLPNTTFSGFGEASLNTALPEFGKDTLSTAPAGFVGSAPPAPSTSLVQGALASTPTPPITSRPSAGHIKDNTLRGAVTENYRGYTLNRANNGKWPCPYLGCDDTFPRLNQTKSHLQSKHLGGWRCNATGCNHEEFIEKNMRLHRRESHGLTKFSPAVDNNMPLRVPNQSLPNQSASIPPVPIRPVRKLLAPLDPSKFEIVKTTDDEPLLPTLIDGQWVCPYCHEPQTSQQSATACRSSVNILEDTNVSNPDVASQSTLSAEPRTTNAQIARTERTSTLRLIALRLGCGT
jgi:hypothetical protein